LGFKDVSVIQILDDFFQVNDISVVMTDWSAQHSTVAAIAGLDVSPHNFLKENIQSEHAL